MKHEVINVGVDEEDEPEPNQFYVASTSFWRISLLGSVNLRLQTQVCSYFSSHLLTVLGVVMDPSLTLFLDLAEWPEGVPRAKFTPPGRFSQIME